MEEISTENNKEINTQKNIDLSKKTYRIFGFILVILLSIVFVLLSIFLFSKGIYDAANSNFEINNFIGSIIIFLIAGIFTYYFPLYSSITVDMRKKLVTIKKYKFLFLNNITTKIDTNKIVRAYTEKNKDEGYGNKDNSFDGFDLIFILNDGHRIVGLEGEIDKNNERRKLNFFLRQFFKGSPDDDDSSVFIQMQNINYQYQPTDNTLYPNQYKKQNLFTNEQKNIFAGINEENEKKYK